jgi:hypothetical protein
MVPTFIIDITGGAVMDVDALLAAAAMSGSAIVSAINSQLGSTVWQSGGSGTPSWGSIVGTLSSQTDLQTALNGKAASSHNHTLSHLSDITVTSDMVSIPKGIRPGLYDDHGTPPLGTIFEGVNDGHLYWCHRDGSVHLLCDSGGYGGGSWGSISGTLSDQTDLQAALNARQPVDATLTAMAGVSTSADCILLFTASDVCVAQGFGPILQALGPTPNAETARAVLCLVIGSDVQAFDAELQAIAELASAADTAPYFTGSGTAALMTVTPAARGLLDDANAAAMRSTLGLVIGSNVQAFDAELQAIAGLASAADKAPYFTGPGTAALMTVTPAGRNLLDDADAAAMRTTIGVDTLHLQTLPGIRSDLYYSSYPSGTTSPRTMTINRIFFTPIFIPHQITVTRIGVNVTTGVTGTMRLGIYNSVAGVPSGAALLDAGTVNVGTTGEKEITVSQVLTPGLYWLASVADCNAVISADFFNQMLTYNLGMLSGSASVNSLCYFQHTSANLPTISSVVWQASTIPPRVWIRTP